MRIAVIVDNPLRDLHACTLICAELSKNHDCYLISSSNAGPEIYQVWPDLVLMNSIRETNKDLIYKLIKSGIAYSVLDTEGGLFMDIPNTTETTYTITLPRDQRLRKNISHYFIWGEVLYKDLIQRKLFEEKKLYCLGTPRMDFFSEPLVQVITGNNISSSADRPIILINTSFAGNNPRYSTKANEMKMLVKKFNYSDEFIQTFFANLDKALYAYIDLTISLAESFPEVDFVLRPHPFEDEKIYVSKFEKYKNIKIIQTGTAGEWILKSKALIHFECSTAIESSFLNVPVFSLSEFLYVRPLEMVQSISDYASSQIEMKEKIQSALNNTYQTPLNLRENLKSLESKLYFKVDGLAYQRISDIIHQSELDIKKNKSFITFLFTILYSIYFIGRAFAKFCYKGTLIPKSKKIDISELSIFLKNLSQAKPELAANCKKLPLSNVFKILNQSTAARHENTLLEDG